MLIISIESDSPRIGKHPGVFFGFLLALIGLLAPAFGNEPVLQPWTEEPGFVTGTEPPFAGNLAGYIGYPPPPYDACEQPSCCCPEQRLGGMFLSTSNLFSDFISPVTNPVYFEDPRNLTEVRTIFLHQNIPNSIGGGGFDLIGMQFRAAVTDRLSLIATKAGFITSDSPLLDDGWTDLIFGLKYQLYADEYAGRLLSVGSTFELPVGSTRALQGQGDGIFNIFATGGTRFLISSHWVTTSGFILPTDRSDNSSLWYWSNHIDHRIFYSFYTFSEYSWYHWMSSGKGGIPGIEGGDLFNLGSTGVSGNDIVTGAIGIKYKPNQSTEVAVAYQSALTNRQDLLENRITFDMIFRY